MTEPGTHRDERKVVTVMFADLVGSTSLAERLDPEEAKLVIGEAVERMIVAVEAFGGTISDVAGDGVLALFGAPTAHEDDAERALRAALRLVEDVGAHGRQVTEAWSTEDVQVRVGLATGPVSLGSLGREDHVLGLEVDLGIGMREDYLHLQQRWRAAHVTLGGWYP